MIPCLAAAQDAATGLGNKRLIETNQWETVRDQEGRFGIRVPSVLLCEPRRLTAPSAKSNLERRSKTWLEARWTDPESAVSFKNREGKKETRFLLAFSHALNLFAQKGNLLTTTLF